VESSRIKDLVDILLFACMEGDLKAERLSMAIQAVFVARHDSIPAQLDQIPSSWRPRFNQLTRHFELQFSQFDDAVQATQAFINPVLGGLRQGTWDPKSWKWGS
jgi:hypothetical protein